MYFKEFALMREFKKNEIFRKYKIFLIDDRAKNLSALGYVNRYSDYSGMFYKIFKDQTRAAANTLDTLHEIIKMPLEYKPRYKLKDVTTHAPEIQVTLTTKEYPNAFTTFKILITSFYSEDSYLEKIDNMMSFQYTSLSSQSPEVNLR